MSRGVDPWVSRDALGDPLTVRQDPAVHQHLPHADGLAPCLDAQLCIQHPVHQLLPRAAPPAKRGKHEENAHNEAAASGSPPRVPKGGVGAGGPTCGAAGDAYGPG